MRDKNESKKNLLAIAFKLIINHPYLTAYVVAVLCAGGSAVLAAALKADLVVGSAVTFAGGFFGGAGTGVTYCVFDKDMPTDSYENQIQTDLESDEEKQCLLIN